MHYIRYWNHKAKQLTHKRAIGPKPVAVPGNLYDLTSRGQPGRFSKWVKLPDAAHRLYWRTHNTRSNLSTF